MVVWSGCGLGPWVMSRVELQPKPRPGVNDFQRPHRHQDDDDDDGDDDDDDD